MIDLSMLIQQSRELAPFPASTVRLGQMISEPNCNLADVTALVAYDEVLTMKLLRAANSAANVGSDSVKTPQDAILRLGLNRVLALAVAAGARPQLQSSAPAYGLDEGALWRHSVAAAVAAETAPAFCAVEFPPEAFSACLLHDIGKVVMSRFLDPEILRFIALGRENDRLSQMQAESEILRVHHGELGGLIAQHWQLPHRIVQGIIYHHDPQQGNDPVCDVACLADHVAHWIEAELDGHRAEFQLPADVAERLGATPERLAALCPVAAVRFQQVSQCYNAV